MKPWRFVAALILAAPPPALAQLATENPICTDRPAKANAVCTVPVGTWQLESSAFAWSRAGEEGAETKVLTLGSSVMKTGISDRSDLQIGFTPYVRLQTHIGRIKTTVSGVGDLIVRYRHRLTAGNAPVQVGAIAFAKLPTAAGGIGNGRVEGGLAVPLSIATGSPVTVVLGPELDLLADADGDGHHAALVNLVNLSAPVVKGLILYGELWTMTNFDPADTVTLASADTALVYAVNDDLQLDFGANFGLNRNTANIEFYMGFGMRF